MDPQPSLSAPSPSRRLEEEQFAELTSCMGKVFSVLNNINDTIELLLGPDSVVEKSRLGGLRGEEAACMMENLQMWLNQHPNHQRKWSIVRALTGIAQQSNTFPPSLFLTNLALDSWDSAFSGGYADVYSGRLGAERVAIKKMRVQARGRDKNDIHRAFCRESILWRQLSHPNIVPFLGVDVQTFKDNFHLAMVSPWLRQGTLMEYVLGDPSSYSASTDRQNLITGAARGLEYLHKQNMAHGDLHSSNVLIDNNGQACLTDFGLAVVGESTRSQLMTSASRGGGMVRWKAPELFSSDQNLSRKSPAADVYAFGRLCLTICTAQQPFPHIKGEEAVLFLVVFESQNPKRPMDSECHQEVGMPDELWQVCESCWEKDPKDRPTMADILGIMN